MQWTQILLAAGTVSLASAQGATTTMSGQMGMSTGMAGGKGKHMGMNMVPMDLSGGFKKEDITIKVEYKNGKMHKGKKGNKTHSATESATMMNMPEPSMMNGMDGMGMKKHHKEHALTYKETENMPKFKLGRHNGTNAQSKWIIIMVDTTDMNNRMMHYVHSGYMMAQNGSLMSTTQPEMAYVAPGKMGEDTKKTNQYTFLMYSQQGDFKNQMMPQMGKSVNVSQWVQANGLQKAIAGKAVAVKQANGTAGASSTGAAGSQPSAQQAAQGAGSSIRTQALSAGVVGAVVAIGMFALQSPQLVRCALVASLPSEKPYISGERPLERRHSRAVKKTRKIVEDGSTRVAVSAAQTAETPRGQQACVSTSTTTSTSTPTAHSAGALSHPPTYSPPPRGSHPAMSSTPPGAALAPAPSAVADVGGDGAEGAPGEAMSIDHPAPLGPTSSVPAATAAASSINTSSSTATSTAAAPSSQTHSHSPTLPRSQPTPLSTAAGGGGGLPHPLHPLASPPAAAVAPNGGSSVVAADASPTQTAEAREALLSSLTNVGTSATAPLEQRAADIHAGNASIATQEAIVQKATADLAKQTAEYAKLADDARGKLKELGDVQNWAEVLERDLLVLEETMRMVEEEGLVPEDDGGGGGGDGTAKGKAKKGWAEWWRGES